MILHHGFIANGRLNSKLPGIVDALVTSGRRVVTIDARGHGRSAKPHDPDRYGEATMAADVARLASELDLRAFDLVGYSMGAVVSVLLASRDRRVRRLVIGGVGAAVVEPGGVDQGELSRVAVAEALETDDPSTIALSAAASFRSFADAVGGDRLALAAQARSMHAAPIPLNRITAPTLVLAGSNNPLARRPEILAAAIPGAVLQLVPGDHLGALGEPAFVESLVDFVNGGSGAD